MYSLFCHFLFIVVMVCCGVWVANAGEIQSIRMARLTIKPDQMEAFATAVKEEMEASLRKEPHVFALYAVADKQDPTRLTFFEMYADEAAYQTHRATPHFQKYFETTGDMIAERVLMEGTPFELRDKHNTKVAEGVPTDVAVTSIRMAYLRIKPDQLENFAAAVKEGMEASVRVEPGVFALYAVTDTNDPTRITFFEMYADEAAYQTHRATPHFQKYFETTGGMIAERVLMEGTPFELRDKHNTAAAQ